ncbi:uncharacterized protein LOC144004677 [Festucalex cinctus]
MANNFWNELSFQLSKNRAIPHYRQIFMGDGKEDFSRWCRHFEVTVGAHSEADEDSLAKLLPTCLGGAAFSYWDSLSDEDKSDYTITKEKLKAVFGQAAYLSTFQSYINARGRLPGEALPVFAAEISRLVEEAFPTYGDDAKSGEKFRRFIAGLDPYLQLRCHEQGVKTLEEALKFAVQIETAHQASRVFAAQGPFPAAPTYPAVSPIVTPPLPMAAPLGVHSANADDMKKMLKTIEALSDKVERLQLTVSQQGQDSQCRGGAGYGFRHRSFTPEGLRRDRYPAERYYGSPPRRRDSSYERNSTSRSAYRTSRRDEEVYNQQGPRTQSESSQRNRRGYSPSRRSYTDRGRSPDRYAGGHHQRSPSPAGRVRFQSPSRPQTDQGNYE